nr:POTRA domain-containing protein [uncultured Desulfobulbus sp.]
MRLRLRQAERFSLILCRRLLALTVLVGPMASSWLHAATPIESASQEYLRQQERERLLRQQQEQAPNVRLQAQAPQEAGRLPSDESPSFMIERIVLTGDTAEQFQWALAFADQTAEGESDPALQRSLGTRGINLVMRRIQNAIVGRGFVTTRVLAEAQDLSTGSLQLTVIPGRIRTIRFAAESDTRATGWNAVPANPGDLLNLRDIEQALENFKRVPTVEADIQITPAEGDEALPGESDLVIAWKQRFPLRLTLSADDSGTKATGKYQGSTTLSGDHLLALNDLLYVNLNHDLGGGGGGGGRRRRYQWLCRPLLAAV